MVENRLKDEIRDEEMRDFKDALKSIIIVAVLGIVFFIVLAGF